ncbi:Molybdopterin binding protein [Cystobasidium minutum MCA 4210]|uniref:Molybdopterin binding protein n=1 Tax=Cystobasidium minutum MCA 4210 TaxID=1397322 RepID=UPI0034CEE92A|eukprot:jgi/Rhomi1/178416/fgenesh1_pg.2_\
MATERPSSPPPTFPTTPVPSYPEGTYVATAACLIIGDEVLNGKTKDSNSNFMAKLLFDLGIDLKRIEVIADDEEEIIEAARRLTSKYDLVVTSGGIGPTHDDITYESIAKAFDDEGKLEYHEDTLHRMWEMGKKRYSLQQQTEEQALARKRMALFPVKNSEVLHVSESLWVPVVRMKGRLCILPGVPRLFEQLLTSYMANYVPLPPSSSKPFRVLIHTKMPESNIAPFLTSLQARVKAEGIRVGSYPKLMQGVDVSLIGKDEARLEELAQECCKELSGEVVAQGKLGQEGNA